MDVRIIQIFTKKANHSKAFTQSHFARVHIMVQLKSSEARPKEVNGIQDVSRNNHYLWRGFYKRMCMLNFMKTT